MSRHSVEVKDGHRKANLQRDLARLERVKKPIQEELDSVDEKISKVKKELERLKDVKAIENSLFLF